MDGLLVREMMSDPLLLKYSVIMLDEAHERTLYTDIVIGLLKKIQKKRENLRIIVSSATLDAMKFFNFFNANSTTDQSKDTCAILTVEGRMYPVDVHYSIDPVPCYLKSTVETVMKIHRQEKPGDILAFLTGQDEVEQVLSLLIEEAKKLRNQEDVLKMRVLPMYSTLSAKEQMKVFDRTPNNTRKIVLATNIAEASITINNIVYIIDCGFTKFKAFSSKAGIESLVVSSVSKASAQQRAGRAGRVRSGKAYRLYTEDAFSNLPESLVPEMQRSDMSVVILQLKALGIDNVLHFNFLSPPPAQNMIRAIEVLYSLGAIDDNCMLTPEVGLKMAEFPLHPMYAKMLLSSGEYNCSEEALTIAAMMQIQNVFFSSPQKNKQAGRAKWKFSVEEGDHITMLNVYNTFLKFNKNPRWCHEMFLNYKGLCRAVEVREQLRRLLKNAKVPLTSCEGDVKAICRCIVSGFLPNVAQLHHSGVYKTLHNDLELHIHPTSVLYTQPQPQWVIYNEIVQTSKMFMRDITVIDSKWLQEIAPHMYQYGTEQELAAKRMRIQ